MDFFKVIMNELKIINANLITPNHIMENGAIMVTDGKIVTLGNDAADMHADTVIDAQGLYVAPGFIDMHVHGGGGHDFMDNTVQAFHEIARLHTQYGTTALTPTTLSCEHKELIETIRTYEQAVTTDYNGAQFIGLHIEGPYFAQRQRGAQDARYIRNPDPAEYEDILNNTNIIKRWSAAPELPGALAFGKYLLSKNVMPAIAHTDAIYEEVIPALESGFKHVTHFYSCTSGVSRRNAYRYAGVIESAYLMDEMTVEIIADGLHLPASLLKLVYKIKGADKIALITDAMRAAGMPPGESLLGGLTNGQKVIVEDGVAKLPDRSAFAGSVATMDRLVRNMINLAGVSLIDAVKMATATPATIMGIADKKGALLPGLDADLVLFDADININATLIGGKTIYQSPAFAGAYKQFKPTV